MTESLSYRLAIPTDDIVADPDTGRDAIHLDGALRPVVYHADSGLWWTLGGEPGLRCLDRPVWRVGLGQWRTGTDEECLARPRLPDAHKLIELPPLPRISVDVAPIPRTIHYIWIGENGIPDTLAHNVAVNAARSATFRTVIHVHAETAQGMARLKRQLTAPGVTVNDLRGDPAFASFMQSPLSPFYAVFLAAPTRNYGAASDMLRVHLLHVHGGIYMDCDDIIVAPFPTDTVPLAAPDDLLLNNMVSAPSIGFHGYNQSSFACQPGNPLLAKMLEGMASRLEEARDYLQAPRPWRPGPDTRERQTSARLDAYIVRILELTGPALLNDVLKRFRPDYYGIERWLLYAYGMTTWSPSEPRYIADEYMDGMRAALAHYVPFAQPPFDIIVGNADSWNRKLPVSR